jgi:uncharacterized membrane protein
MINIDTSKYSCGKGVIKKYFLVNVKNGNIISTTISNFFKHPIKTRRKLIRKFNGKYSSGPIKGTYVEFDTKEDAKKAKDWLESKIVLKKMGVE